MTALGSLLVSLGLDSAEFTRGLTKAENESRRAMKNIQREAEAMGRFVGAAAVIAGAGAVAMAAKFISAAADLDDFAEKTGASVEELSKLTQQARISGTDLGTVESSLIKLSKALHGSDEEAKGAGKALAALGLRAEDLRGKDTAVALQIVAKELNRFADGSGKSALALDLFGKAGAQALPFLKDMANDAALAANVTTKQAAEAEELGKSWRRLANDARTVGQSLALELVPVLQSIITQMRLAKELGGGFLSGVASFFSVSGSDPIGEINETYKSLEKLKALRADLMKPSLGGFVADVGDKLSFGLGSNDLASVNKQIKAAEERMKFLTKLAITQGGTDKFDLMTAKPALDYKPTDGADAAKKKLEEIKKLYEEVSRLGASIDVPLLPVETFLKGGLDKAKTDLDGIKKTLTEGKKDWIAYAQSVFDTADAEQTAAAQGKSFTEVSEELTEKILNLIDPTRQLTKENEALDKAFADGSLRVTEYQLQLAKLDPAVRALLQPTDNIWDKIQRDFEAGFLTVEKMQEAMLRAADSTDKATESAKDFGHAISTAFEDAVIEGRKLKDVVNALGVTIAKIFFRQQVTKPLEEAIGGLGGIGGIIKAIFGGGSVNTGGSGSGGQGAATAAETMAFWGHTGGIVGRLTDTSAVNAGHFYSAPRFHSGGLVGGEVPIIAKRGEGIFTSEQMKHLSPAVSAPPVQIIQNINIDSRTDSSIVAREIERGTQKAIAAIPNMVRRGGAYKRAVRG